MVANARKLTSTGELTLARMLMYGGDNKFVIRTFSPGLDVQIEASDASLPRRSVNPKPAAAEWVSPSLWRMPDSPFAVLASLPAAARLAPVLPPAEASGGLFSLLSLLPVCFRFLAAMEICRRRRKRRARAERPHSSGACLLLNSGPGEAFNLTLQWSGRLVQISIIWHRCWY